MNEKKFIRLFTWLTIFLVGSIAVISFYLSYSVLSAVALDGGKAAGQAALWPLIIDLPVVAFSMAAIFAIVLGNRWFAGVCRLVVVLATGVTIYFNVHYANIHGQSWQVAIAAPIAYVVSFEVLAWLFEVLSIRTMSVRKLSDIRLKIGEYRAKLRSMADNLKTEQDNYADMIADTKVYFEQQRGQLIADYEQFKQQLEDNRQAAKGQFETEARQRAAKLDDIDRQIGVSQQTIKSYQDDIEAAKIELASIGQQSVTVYLPDNLTIDQRQYLVSKMASDGKTNAEIAGLLGVSEGTIKNDKKALRVGQNGTGH